MAFAGHGMCDYRLERARSGLSTCKGHCKMFIPKGHYRLGSITSFGLGPFWRDLNCITARQLTNVAETYGTVYAFVESRTEIPNEDKELLMRYFQVVLIEDQATREEVYAALLPRPEELVVGAKAPRKTNKRKGLEEDGDQGVKPAPSPQPPVPGQGEQDALPQQAPQKAAKLVETALTVAAVPPSIVTKGGEARTSVSVAPPLPTQNLPTELERAVVYAVATLGSADMASIHDQLSRALRTGYKKGPVSSAIGRCVAKDFLQLAPAVQVGEDIPSHYQCTPDGLRALQRRTAPISAPPAPVSSMMPTIRSDPVIKTPHGTGGSLPVLDADRMARALKEKQQCLCASLSGTADRPHGRFSVVGAKSGSRYTVELSVVDMQGQVQVSAKCNCLDVRQRGGAIICKHSAFVAGRVLGMVLQAGQPLSVQDFITAASAYGATSSSFSSSPKATGATISGPPSLSNQVLQPPQAAIDQPPPVSPTHSLADYVLPTSPDTHALLPLSQAFLHDFSQGPFLPPPPSPVYYAPRPLQFQPYAYQQQQQQQQHYHHHDYRLLSPPPRAPPPSSFPSTPPFLFSVPPPQPSLGVASGSLAISNETPSIKAGQGSSSANPNNFTSNI